jgi:hypothetical protein
VSEGGERWKSERERNSTNRSSAERDSGPGPKPPRTAHSPCNDGTGNTARTYTSCAHACPLKSFSPPPSLPSPLPFPLPSPSSSPPSIAPSPHLSCPLEPSSSAPGPCPWRPCCRTPWGPPCAQTEASLPISSFSPPPPPSPPSSMPLLPQNTILVKSASDELLRVHTVTWSGVCMCVCVCVCA